MAKIPLFVSLVFGLTTLATVFLFYMASGRSLKVLIILAIWLAVQTVAAVAGIYQDTDSVPPPFILAVLPPLALIGIIFSTTAGQRFIDTLNIRFLTLLHVVRIPVELVLFWLFIYGSVPKIMTFEGQNFDILAGISAGIVYNFVFVRKKLGNRGLLAWNLLCTALLLNIVITAILAAPFPFQQIAFDQPNRAVFYFPFIWLPCCIVPLVLFSHLVAIRRLYFSQNTQISQV